MEAVKESKHRKTRKPKTTPPPSLDACVPEDGLFTHERGEPSQTQKSDQSTSALQAMPSINESPAHSEVQKSPDTVEIIASAPSFTEQPMSKIYPELPKTTTAADVTLQTVALEVEDPLETNFPDPFTQKDREKLFFPVTDSWLNELEDRFLAGENSNSTPVFPDQEILRKQLKEVGRLQHQLERTLVQQRRATQHKIAHLEDEMWQFQEQTYEAAGVCTDGRIVITKTDRKVATLDRAQGNEALATLSNALEEQIAQEKTTNMKLQYLLHAIEACLAMSDADAQKRYLSELAFALRQEGVLCPDREKCSFQKHLRQWFRFMAVHYVDRYTREERMYVLHHLLRFPGGIGTWATDLIHPLSVHTIELWHKQPELSRLSDVDMLDVILVLNAIMKPITERNRFILAGVSDEGEDQSAFAWVDSDGESEDDSSDRMLHPLKEDDLIKLLNQVPMEVVFCSITNDMRQPNIYGFLHGIVVADVLVQIFSKGCRTYGSMHRYKNFIKLVGLLINHMVGNVDDAMTQLPPSLPPETRQRTQLEYDLFVYHTARRLYEAHATGLWQYLSQLPFERVTTRTLWGLYWAIRTGEFSMHGPSFTPDKANVSMRFKMLPSRDNNECFYTLQMLGYMAEGRDAKVNSQFIQVVAMNFMELLFLMDGAEEIKRQYLVAQLQGVVSKHPCTISTLLQTADEYMASADDGKLVPSTVAVHLTTIFHHNYLPLRLWAPSEDDIDLVLRWFEQHECSSPFHLMASELLTHIPYGLKGVRRVMPREWQFKIARKVAHIYRRRTAATTDTIEGFATRCLVILQQLRVHAMDQSDSRVQQLLQISSTAESYCKHVEDEPLLIEGHAAGCPVTSMAVALITTAGHWPPNIYRDGIRCVRIVSFSSIPAAIRCLELMFPILVNYGIDMTDNELFSQVLGGILQEESSAPKNEFGPLQAMMETQITQYRRYGFLSPMYLIKFWTSSILCCPSNVPENEPAMRLLNQLACFALGARDAWYAMRQVLNPLFEDPAIVKPARSRLGQLFQRIIPNEPISMYTNIPVNYIPLALMVFEIEHQRLEVQNGLWPRLLTLLNSEQNITLNEALARVCNTLGLNYCPPGNMLVVYKQARLLSRLEFTHPLFSLLCQQFFTVLLTRIKSPSPGACLFGAKQHLLRADSGLTEQLQSKLHQAELHYLIEQPNVLRTVAEKKKSAKNYCTVRMFNKWMQNKQLDTMMVDEMHCFAAEYDVPRLILACTQSREYWTDLVDWSDQQTATTNAIEQWMRTFRSASLWPEPEEEPFPVPFVSRKHDLPPRRIYEYGKPANLPVVSLSHTSQGLVIRPITYIERVDRMLIALKMIDDYTERRYWLTIKELERLKMAMFDKMSVLFTNEESKVRQGVKCGFFCSGEGSVSITIKVAKRSAVVWHRLEDLRRDFASTVESAIYLPPHIMDNVVLLKLLWASFFNELGDMIPPIKKTPEPLRILLRATFSLLRKNTADHVEYAVEPVVHRCMKTLPQMFYNELLKEIIAACKEERKLSNFLLKMVTAKNVPGPWMMNLYRLLTARKGNIERTLFVQLFGEKFNFSSWLLETKISQSECSEFLKHMSVPLLTEGDNPGTVSDEDNLSFFQVLLSHLVMLAHHNFPTHFCEVLQTMLNSLSTNDLVPTTMLLDLVNYLRDRSHLPALSLGMDEAAIRKAHHNLALATTNQHLHSTVIMRMLSTVAIHFANQRQLLGSLSGLYKHHKTRVEELSLLFGAIAHLGIWSDSESQLFEFNVMQPHIFGLFEPWLLPVSNNTTNTVPPWVVDYDAYVSHMIQPLVHAIETSVETLGANSASLVLFGVFEWYVRHFNNQRVERNVLLQMHQHLLSLPWEQLRPSDAVVVCFNNVLQNFVPECHKFIGAVFLRCQWVGADCTWLDEDTAKTSAMLLLLSVKLGFEPSIRNDKQSVKTMVRVLQEITSLPWYLVDVSGLESALDWYTSTADSSVVLRSNVSPTDELDRAILNLLEIASGVNSNKTNPLRAGPTESFKRGLFVRTTVRQLVQAATVQRKSNVKQQLGSVVQKLFSMIVAVLETSQAKKDILQDLNETQLHDVRTMLTAMVLGIRNAENVLQIFIAEATQVLRFRSSSSLPLAQGMLEVAKLFCNQTAAVMSLTETALIVVLCTPDQDHNQMTYSWMRALELVGTNTVCGWQEDVLGGEGHLLCMQLHFVAQWGAVKNSSIARLELLRHLLRRLKTAKKESDEHHLYPLWLTMMYAVLALAPSTPKELMRPLVESVGDYLLQIAEPGQRNWIFEMVQALMTVKKTPTSSQRIIACAFNYCISTAYRTIEPDHDEDDPEGNEGPSDGSVGSGNATSMLTDPVKAFHPLLNDQSLTGQREQIEELMAELQSSRLDIDSTPQLAISIIERFEPRARNILRTLVQALRTE